MQVFTNKAIFLDSSWRLSQLTFASFHFFVTWVTLFALSRPRLGYFTPRRASIRHLLPLAVAMCLNVILPNLSLAFSSVTFYQVARILLTPMVALMNYVLYGATLPSLAIVTLVPACLGVGMVSYYDSLPIGDASIKSTSPLGVVFAFVGIFASSLYTVWIASYHRTLKMSSMQLLYNQAPIASLMLLYIIPFLDAFPDWAHISTSRWMMIALVRQPPPPPPSKCRQALTASSPGSLLPLSTYRSSSLWPRLVLYRAPSLDTSRPVPLCASAGSCRAAPQATGPSLEFFLPLPPLLRELPCPSSAFAAHTAQILHGNATAQYP